MAIEVRTPVSCLQRGLAGSREVAVNNFENSSESTIKTAISRAEHTDEGLREAGYSDTEIVEMRATKIV